MAASSEMSHKLFKSRKVILSQLQERGFDISNYDNFSMFEINTLNKTKQLDMLVENKDTGKKVYVKYHQKARIQPDNIYDYVDDLFNIEETLKETDDLIIITLIEMNKTIQSYLENLYSTENIYCSVININRLLFNVLEHSLVPKHIKITKDESRDLMKDYNITHYSHFPEISRFDPVAIAIGLRPGNICRIERPSKTSIISNYYRYCM